MQGRQEREMDGENKKENKVTEMGKKGDLKKASVKDQKEKPRQRGRESNYRTPSVFKAPLLSNSSCG